MDPFKQYSNTSEEKDGVWTEVNPVWKLKLARAGGINTAFEATLNKVLKVHRRRLAQEELPVSAWRKIHATVYAAAVVKGWQSKVGEDWQDGITAFEMTEDGPRMLADQPLLPVTKENVEKVLLALPDFLQVIMEICEEATTFRSDMLETVTGN